MVKGRQYCAYTPSQSFFDSSFAGSEMNSSATDRLSILIVDEMVASITETYTTAQCGSIANAYIESILKLAIYRPSWL